jgi:sugar phosphate isomerase/epimerase
VVGLASAALAAPPVLKPAAQRYLIGLQLYTVRDVCAKDFPGTLKQVAAAGFSGVEFAGYYGYSAEALRKMLDEDHLACYGTHLQLDDLLGDNFAKTVAFNKVLGNHLLTVASLPGDRRNTKEALIATAHVFSDIAAKLKPYGMMIAYHNHAAEFEKLDGEYAWDIFFGNSTPDVKIQFDTGNAMSVGIQAAPYLTKYPGRVVSTHVKDFSPTNDKALLGEGVVNWGEVIPIYKSRTGPRWFIIEQESYPFPSIVCAQKCLTTFKKLMGLE